MDAVGDVLLDDVFDVFERLALQRDVEAPSLNVGSKVRRRKRGIERFLTKTPALNPVGWAISSFPFYTLRHTMYDGDCIAMCSMEIAS